MLTTSPPNCSEKRARPEESLTRPEAKKKTRGQRRRARRRRTTSAGSSPVTGTEQRTAVISGDGDGVEDRGGGGSPAREKSGSVTVGRGSCSGLSHHPWLSVVYIAPTYFSRVVAQPGTNRGHLSRAEPPPGIDEVFSFSFLFLFSVLNNFGI